MCFGMSDAYCEYRDSCGRFTVGNPGRVSYSWLSGDEFSERYGFLRIVVPSPCSECGGLSYRFNVRFDGKNSYVVRCKCNYCNSESHYSPYSDSWGSI